MNKILKRIGIYSIVVVMCMTNISYASIFDDVWAMLGIKKKTEATVENAESEKVVDETIKEIEKKENTRISKELYDELDSDEKLIVDGLIESFDNLYDVDVDKIKNFTDNRTKDYIDKYVVGFFNEYPDAKEKLKEILRNVDYKIVDVNRNANKINVNISYTYPEIGKLIKDILPKLIVSNIGDILSGKISNEFIAKFIVEASNQLFKKNYNTENNAFVFTFVKAGDYWLLDDFSKIYKALSEFVKESASLLK